MKEVFPHLTHKQLVLKFNKEDKADERKVTNAVRNRKSGGTFHALDANSFQNFEDANILNAEEVQAFLNSVRPAEEGKTDEVERVPGDRIEIPPLRIDSGAPDAAASAEPAIGRNDEAAQPAP